MKKTIFLSCFMALALCLSLMPTAALAAEDTTEPSTQLTEPTSVPEEPEEPETPDQPEETKTPDPSEEPPQDEEPLRQRRSPRSGRCYLRLRRRRRSIRTTCAAVTPAIKWDMTTRGTRRSPSNRGTGEAPTAHSI